jgi:hypothetical protein
MTWPVAKLGSRRAGAHGTADNVPNVADDGSDEDDASEKSITL